MSSVGSKTVDLEEGEIEEDALEDISDCSLSEALVTQKDFEHDSDIEFLRAEALKSLEEDEVSEEELYRLEALKSLLTNIESSNKISPAEEIRKKKRKHKKKSKRKKSIKLDSSEVLKTVNDYEKSKLLVEASAECIPTSELDNSSNMDFSDKENQTDSDTNLVTRSWYPKTDFALLNFSANEMSNETKQRPRKNCGNDDFIIIPRILSVTNNDTKSTINETMTKGKPVDRSLKFSRMEMPINRIPVPISRLNYSVLPSAAHLSRYKKISKQQMQRYPVTQPTNRFSLRNFRKGRYKLVNRSCYSLKKSVNSSPTMTEKQNTLSKSVYSLNRVQKLPNSSKPSPFIIELNEDDSGKEDNGSVATTEKPRSTGVRNLDVQSPEMRNSELPCRELPDRLISARTPENLLDECVAEISSSMVEKEADIESLEMSVGETEDEVPADLPTDEATHLLDVTTSTALTTGFYVTSASDNECISHGRYSEEINDETEVSKTIPDAIDECPAVSLHSEDEKIDETNAEMQTPNPCSQETNSPNQSDVSDVSKMPPHIEECDVDFLPHANSVLESERLTKESELANVAVSTPEDYETRLVIKEEPFDFDPAENLSLEGKMECDVANDAEINNCENLTVLEDVEADLIEIRARLLLNLGELEEGLKKDESEKEKLNTMLKKLLVLKSSIFRFENKIRAHQSKMSIHADSMQALFQECAATTDTCAHMKDVCFRVGTGIKGPCYKPPDLYENVIEEKIRAIDLSKFAPNFQ